MWLSAISYSNDKTQLLNKHRKMFLAALKLEWQKRPWWMNLIWFFTLYMTIIYMPFDIFIKGVAGNEEVWFGIVLHGWWAKVTEPLHWLIYGFGAYGFWKMRPWMHPWAAIYVGQIAFSMFVWNLIDPRGAGLVAACISALIFVIPAITLWRSRARFVET